VARIGGWAVPLGGVAVPVVVPAGWQAVLASPPTQPAIADLDAAIAEALDRPLGTASLRELAADRASRATSNGRRPTAVIAVTDATRDCPDDRFLPPLLAEIEAGGIAPDEVTIVVATGLHRPSTDEEKRRKVGDRSADRYRIVDHDARDPSAIVDLGRTGAGFPIAIDRLALEADLLVSTGVVEPHQYAGYSGGAKTVAIGLAGEPTIDATHSIAMADDPGVRLGRLDGNPFHEAVVEIGRRVGLDFVVNVVLDPDGRPLAVAAGDPEAVHHRLADVAARAFTVEVARRVDVAIAGVGAGKDANLYQATRAVTYLHYAPTPAVRAGGVYLLPATLTEGAGGGAGERRFFEALRDAPSPEALVERLRRGGTRAGEQRAYLVARVLQQAAIVVVGAEHPEVPEACGMRTAPTLEAGLALAGELARATLPAAERDRTPELLVVPNAIRTLPIVASSAGEEGPR
jgi:nickel-dependent lactate racemase